MINSYILGRWLISWNIVRYRCLWISASLFLLWQISQVPPDLVVFWNWHLSSVTMPLDSSQGSGQAFPIHSPCSSGGDSSPRDLRMVVMLVDEATSQTCFSCWMLQVFSFIHNHSTLTRCPVPDAAKNPHSETLPAMCFPVGTLFLELNACPFFSPNVSRVSVGKQL